MFHLGRAYRDGKFVMPGRVLAGAYLNNGKLYINKSLSLRFCNIHGLNLEVSLPPLLTFYEASSDIAR